VAGTTRRWSKGVEIERGGLHGWHEDESDRKRHEALERSVREDGYATAIRRLNFLANVANRQDNEHLHVVAERDLRWLEKEHEEER
jgi:hypothetical protein